MSFYLMHRGWMDDPSFKNEPFTEREAFMWMIENAVWESEGRRHRVANTNKLITLKRGQISFSYRELSKKWGWSLSKVQRYTHKMEIDTHISTETDTGETVITICNYEKYQNRKFYIDTAASTAASTAAIQQPIHTKDKEGKELKEPVDDDTRARVSKIFEEVEKIISSPTPLFSSPVSKWVDAGATDDDIREAARVWKARNPQRAMRSLGWLDELVASAMQQRLNPMPELPPPKENGHLRFQSFEEKRQEKNKEVIEKVMRKYDESSLASANKN